MGDTVNVTLTAPIDMDTAAVENGTVQVTNNTTGERTDVTVTERSASSTVFTGSFELPNAESFRRYCQELCANSFAVSG